MEYRLWEMPTLITIAGPGSLTPPTVLPAGAPSPEYWEGFFHTGWQYGSYAYVIWDPDHQNWGSFAVAAYDNSWNIVREWLISGNRYIDGIMMNHSNGNIEIAGQSGISELYWLDYRPPFN